MKLAHNVYAALTFLLLALIGLVANKIGPNYPGNFYFRPCALYIEFNLFIFYIGFYLMYGKNSSWAIRTKELIFYVPMIAIMLIATTAAQFTPFNTIDNILINFDKSLHIDTLSILQWTENHPAIKTTLECAYVSLSYQLGYLPFLIIITGHINIFREYTFLTLSTAIMGYGFYYFFPSSAPASILNSGFFSSIQKATGLKFYQIHHYIPPTTFDGGMISLPSFHVIWAWLCVYLIRDWPIACAFLAIVNLTLVAATVLLGWHYFVDIIGSAIIILLAHMLYSYINTRENAIDRSISPIYN